MPLVPLSNKVVGTIVGSHAMPGMIVDPFGNNRKAKLALKVEHVGPGCKEVEVGDTVILPDGGWVTVTLLEDDENTPVEKIAIHEDLLLAKVK